MLLYESGEGREARLKVGVVLEGSEGGVGPVLMVGIGILYIALEVGKLLIEGSILGLERGNEGLERCNLSLERLLGSGIGCAVGIELLLQVGSLGLEVIDERLQSLVYLLKIADRGGDICNLLFDGSDSALDEFNICLDSGDLCGDGSDLALQCVLRSLHGTGNLGIDNTVVCLDSGGDSFLISCGELVLGLIERILLVLDSLGKGSIAIGNLGLEGSKKCIDVGDVVVALSQGLVDP